MNIMHLRREHVEARANERGYTVDSIQPCFLKEMGDGLWEVDVEHEAYPKAREPAFGAQPVADEPAVPEEGPGTELKKLLKNWLGITASPNCACNARARQMDQWGPDLCEQNLPEIVGWLEEQARARNLPFVRFAGEQAVKLAIRRARKAAKK
jgi:hypothetical protein